MANIRKGETGESNDNSNCSCEPDVSDSGDSDSMYLLVREPAVIGGCLIGQKFSGRIGAVFGGFIAGQITDGITTVIQSRISKKVLPYGTWNMYHLRWKYSLFFISDISFGLIVMYMMWDEEKWSWWDWFLSTLSVKDVIDISYWFGEKYITGQ